MAKKKRNNQTPVPTNESTPIDELSVDQAKETVESEETEVPAQTPPVESDFEDDLDLLTANEAQANLSGPVTPAPTYYEEPVPTTGPPSFPETDAAEPEVVEPAVDKPYDEDDADIDALDVQAAETFVEIDLDAAAALEDSLTSATTAQTETASLPSKPGEYEAYLEALGNTLTTFDKNILKALGGLSGKLFFTDVTLLISKAPEAAAVLKKVNNWHRKFFGTHAKCWSDSQQERQQAVADYKKTKNVSKPPKSSNLGERDDEAIRKKMQRKLDSRRHLL